MPDELFPIKFDTEYVFLAFPGFGGDVLAGYGDRRTFGLQIRSQF
ncbi:MAG: hypothetical protein AAF609_23550 [Cyanobacteria bacterium P01_C01_bin.120]